MVTDKSSLKACSLHSFRNLGRGFFSAAEPGWLFIMLSHATRRNQTAYWLSRRPNSHAKHEPDRPREMEIFDELRNSTYRSLQRQDRATPATFSSPFETACPAQQKRATSFGTTVRSVTSPPSSTFPLGMKPAGHEKNPAQPSPA